MLLQGYHISLIKKAVKTAILQNITVVFYFNIFSNVIYFCDGKAEFSASFFGLQFHRILQKSKLCN